MKLLFLTPQLPFGRDQGTKLRNFHLMRLAAEAGHEVHLLTFAGRPPDLSGPATPTRPDWCASVSLAPGPPSRGALRRLADLARPGRPDLLRRLWSPAFEAALLRLQTEQRFDLVQIEGLELAAYRPAVDAPSLVFDDHNVEYLLQRRAFEIDLRQPRRAHAAFYSLLQWQRLRKAERAVCQAADAVLAVSTDDARRLERLTGRPVEVVANGLDLAGLPAPAERSGPAYQLLFDGTMSFRPNHDAATWFCQQVLPRLRQRQPAVRFWVVGRDPPPDLVRYNYGPCGVAVTGTVPSVEPYWERADLYVLPMRMGGGVRFKALEALGRGLPIVSTALGMEGTAALAGRDYLRAETADEFVAAVLRLLDDGGLRRRLGANARLAAEQHDWPRIGSALRAVYERLATRAPDRRARCDPR